MMSKHNVSTLEVYKILKKSNCGECGAKTCFAFAALVTQGEYQITKCPYLPDDILVVSEMNNSKKSIDQEQMDSLSQLKSQFVEIDFVTAANHLGASVKGDLLEIKCLGRNFFVSRTGHISSDIHVHPWVEGPILNYIINHNNVNPSGKWVTFKALPSGSKWYPLYNQRCEKPLLRIADSKDELFSKILALFGKETKIHGISADLTVLCHPLPKFPLLICYTRSEEGLESNLTLYYDEKSEEIINIEAVYSLVVGMSIMIEKIVRRHS